jgi:DNA polymerase elongation subunit (family B)
MKGNIPIPDLPFGEEVWMLATVTSVRSGYAKQAKPFRDLIVRNPTGTISVKVWTEALLQHGEITTGLWKIAGKLDVYQNQRQFIASKYRRAELEEYREHLGCDPLLPRAFTIDIETIPLPEYRGRVGPKLEREFRLAKMRIEQQQRYLEDIAAEEEHQYQLGSFSATSGRILCIAVHVGPVRGLEIEGLTSDQSEHTFGIDAEGNEQEEAEALKGFLSLMSDFDPDCDLVVGHNIISFDLPFIFQRCLANNIPVKPFIDLGEFHVRGAYDTMRAWWLGERRSRVGLDDLAWALGFESSKTAEVEGSKVFDLYQAGRLAEIREYNLNDVRVTRKVYEHMVACFGG